MGVCFHTEIMDKMFFLSLLAIFFNTLIMIIEIRRENVTVISILLKCAFKYYQKR